uniref:Uncharacterized protein n=1 Tax=Leersia perrieri TaxID=77586 RepID=A0A0D9V6E0_9ORYZ
MEANTTRAYYSHFYHAPIDKFHQAIRAHPVLQECLFAKQIPRILRGQRRKPMDMALGIHN